MSFCLVKPFPVSSTGSIRLWVGWPVGRQNEEAAAVLGHDQRNISRGGKVSIPLNHFFLRFWHLRVWYYHFSFFVTHATVFVTFNTIKPFFFVTDVRVFVAEIALKPFFFICDINVFVTFNVTKKSLSLMLERLTQKMNQPFFIFVIVDRVFIPANTIKKYQKILHQC